jgi:hypothetical protein
MTGAALQPWPWKTAALLFLLSALFLGRNLGFSGYVHDDEPNKVRQITQDKYNFNHPLLMIGSVKWYAAAAGITGSETAVLRAGRWSSVVFSSLALALLVLVTGRLHGAFVAAAAGIFIFSTPLLFELSHYFKEDPALLFGISLVILAVQLYGENPAAGRAALLGAACGAAVSAKYAGLMVLPLALGVILAARRPRDLATLAALAAGVFILVNLPMVLSPEVWKGRVDRELVRLQAKEVPNQRSIPHGVYFAVLSRNATPVLAVLFAVYLFTVVRRRLVLPPAEWAMLIVPAIYLLVPSFIPTVSNRYILPACVLFACVAAAGLGPLLARKNGKFVGVILVAGSLVWQLPELLAQDQAFTSRRHAEVIQFIRSKLPEIAVVLVDNYQSIDPPNFQRPVVKQRRLEPGETYETLRGEGYTHLLITSERYPVYSLRSRRASKLSPEDTLKMRALYEDIFARATPVFQWEEGKNKRLNPEFRLYEISPPPQPGTSP